MEDSHTLNSVFCRHYAVLVAWCGKQVRPEVGDPEEFVHLAYLRCRKTWRADRTSVNGRTAAYLFQALRWVVLDELRRFARRRARSSSVSPAPVCENQWTQARRLIVDEVLGLLPGGQRQVCLAMLTGKSQAQIASECGISPGAVAVRLSRAKMSLLEGLELR